MPQTFSVAVESAKEFKEAVGHANALGFEIDEVYATGHWEDNNTEPVFVSSLDVERVSSNFIHADVDGETTPIRPDESDVSGVGKARITFKKV